LKIPKKKAAQLGRNAAHDALIAGIGKQTPFNYKGHEGHEGTQRNSLVACEQEISRSEGKWLKKILLQSAFIRANPR
jgi:hypothetical protein